MKTRALWGGCGADTACLDAYLHLERRQQRQRRPQDHPARRRGDGADSAVARDKSSGTLLDYVLQDAPTSGGDLVWLLRGRQPPAARGQPGHRRTMNSIVHPLWGIINEMLSSRTPHRRQVARSQTFAEAPKPKTQPGRSLLQALRNREAHADRFGGLYSVRGAGACDVAEPAAGAG